MKRYTTRQKNDLLRQLLLNAGDVALTSAQTGVPENTLYRWRREALRPLPAPPPPLAALTDLPATDDSSHPLSVYDQRKSLWDGEGAGGRGSSADSNRHAQSDCFSPLPEFGEGPGVGSTQLTTNRPAQDDSFPPRPEGEGLGVRVGSIAGGRGSSADSNRPAQADSFPPRPDANAEGLGSGVGSIAGGRGSDPLPTLRQRLIDHAFRISDSLDASLEDAPLSQRAQALSQIIDRIMKLSALQPKEQVLHIVYEDQEDDPFYTPPSESEGDYQE